MAANKHRRRDGKHEVRGVGKNMWADLQLEFDTSIYGKTHAGTLAEERCDSICI